MKRRGFTLIELLVVIAIIAILAAILFPVFANAKERGRQARCCSNLKQLTMSFFGYADDHNGRLPIGSRRLFEWHGVSDPVEWTGTTWLLSGTPPVPIDVRKGSLFPYVRNVEVYQCPTDKSLPTWFLVSGVWTKIKGPPSPTPGFGLSYSLNGHLGYRLIGPTMSSLPTTIKLQTATAGRASKMMFLMHETRGAEGKAGINDGYLEWPADTNDKIHYEGTDCSFADGHVKWLSNDQMAKIQKLGYASPWARNGYYYWKINNGAAPDPNYTD